MAVKCSPLHYILFFLTYLKFPSRPAALGCVVFNILQPSRHGGTAGAAATYQRAPTSAPLTWPVGHYTTTLAALTATVASCATVVLMLLVVFVATTTLAALDALTAMVHNITIVNQFRSVIMEYLVNIGGGVLAILAVFTAVFYFSDVFMRLWDEVLLENPTILISVVLVTLGALAVLSAVML